MTEAKQPERGIGGGRVRRKKGGRKATPAGRGEAEVNAGAVPTALLRPHGRHGCVAAHVCSLTEALHVANVYGKVSSCRPSFLVKCTSCLNTDLCNGWQCRTRTRGGRCSRRRWRPCSRLSSGSSSTPRRPAPSCRRQAVSTVPLHARCRCAALASVMRLESDPMHRCHNRKAGCKEVMRAIASHLCAGA